MKLKKVSTEQFAGIRSKEVTFVDGVNVVFGKNESGKSTLVDLISGILFQNARIDGRSDKSFKESAFPAKRIDGKRFGSIDGTAVIEADGGEYKLIKEWGDEEVSRLYTPDGIIKNQARINEILGDILGYGEGVYREMLLSPQSSAADNLKKVLDGKGSETRRTLSEAVSEAMSESGGVSVQELEKRINEKIDALAANWDIDRNAPKKKRDGGRWKIPQKDETSVLKFLYAWEDAEKECEDLKCLEDKLDDALKQFNAAEAAAKDAERALEEFGKYADSIRAMKVNSGIIKRCEEDIERFNKELEEFPRSKEALENARRLKEEKENRALLDRYLSAKKFHDELRDINGRLSGLSCPEDGEIEALRSAERDIPRLKNELRGMNVAAKIRLPGGAPVKITSLISGEEIAFDGENARISEAVRVEIPGVMEMELSPADVNADEINSEIAALKKKTSEIFDRYGVGSLEELIRLAEDYNDLVNAKISVENELRAALAGIGFDELKQKADVLTNVRGSEVIDGEIAALCKGGDINVFIGARSADIERFTDDFGSVEELKSRIAERTVELEKARAAVETADGIPEKYRGISDPEEHKDRLKDAAALAKSSKDDALDKRGKARGALDAFVEGHDDGLREKCETAKREFEAQTKLLDNWLHIREVFNALKNEVSSDPLGSLADNFVNNLGIISENKVTAEFAEAGKPDFGITSGDYELDFAKLSDGTKETVYLAFRLAVLDHLFPGGGGVIVLDDPLNDMDTDRIKRSCRLIAESAKRHQIIFLTCREDYAGLLGGNVIHI